MTDFRARNFWLMSTEGGFFLGGLAFISVETVLPALVKELGGPVWLIALMPVLLVLGFMAPTVLTAHWVERLHRMKPVVLVSGAAQRLPFLVAAVMLWIAGENWPLATLVVVALAPLLSGLMGGLTVTAFLELMGRVISPGKLASMNGLRNLIGAVIGLAAGPVIALVLTHLPGTRGYAVLHGLCFAFLAVSFVLIGNVHEPSVENLSRETLSFRQSLLGLRALWTANRAFRIYLFIRLLSAGLMVLSPFLALFSLEILRREDSYLGELVSWTMAGSILGNLLAGVVGDHLGSHKNYAFSLITLLLVPLTAAVASRFPYAWLFGGAFFFLGLGRALQEIAHVTMSLELFSGPRRPTCLAWISALSFAGLLAVSLLGGWVRQQPHALLMACLITGVCLSAALALIFLLPAAPPRSDAHGNPATVL